MPGSQRNRTPPVALPATDLVEEVRRMAAQAQQDAQARFGPCWGERRQQKLREIEHARRELRRHQRIVMVLERWLSQNEPGQEDDAWAECDDGQDGWRKALDRMPGTGPGGC